MMMSRTATMRLDTAEVLCTKCVDRFASFAGRRSHGLTGAQLAGVHLHLHESCRRALLSRLRGSQFTDRRVRTAVIRSKFALLGGTR